VKILAAFSNLNDYGKFAERLDCGDFSAAVGTQGIIRSSGDLIRTKAPLERAQSRRSATTGSFRHNLILKIRHELNSC